MSGNVANDSHQIWEFEPHLYIYVCVCVCVCIKSKHAQASLTGLIGFIVRLSLAC